MSAYLLSILAVVVAYLIGAIPFGFMIGLWAKGVDVRTVGSGNIGATNVGRVLGFRWFWPVFLLDVAKGFVPTWGFPIAVAAMTGKPAPPDLAVLVALASILGHNYPVYLRFKGGKGVATSLGAMFALDPFASLAAAIGFAMFLSVTRYVSMSSLLGGLVFFLAHFGRVEAPWAREQRAMTVLTVGLIVLLVVRHRKNLARIGAGTEPKVSLRKKRDAPPAGRIATVWLVALAASTAFAFFGWALWARATTREVLTVGQYAFTEVARVGTGHQRAERVAFADGGNLLAVTCPRYDRLVLYRVTAQNTLEPLVDLALEGKPVAVWPTGDKIYVLLRPSGDRRHVEPGWWETFDFRGTSVGQKVRVGFYPDDLALSPDGRHAYVLTSGRAEGDSHKPSPALDVFETADPSKPIGHVTFDGAGDDPARLTVSATGRCAAVTLLGSKQVAAVELVEATAPRVIGRTALADRMLPYPSRTTDDLIVMPVASGAESIMMPLTGPGDCVASTLPHGSGLELSHWESPNRTEPSSPTSGQGRSLGRLTLRAGTFNLGTTRPTGLAYSPDRNLIAVANRSGGVHLIAVKVAAVSVATR